MEVHIVDRGRALCGYPLSHLPPGDHWVGLDHYTDAPESLRCANCMLAYRSLEADRAATQNAIAKFQVPDEEWLIDQARQNETGTHVALAQALIIAMEPGEAFKFTPRILRAFQLPLWNPDGYRDEFHRMKTLIEVYCGGNVVLSQNPLDFSIVVERI